MRERKIKLRGMFLLAFAISASLSPVFLSHIGGSRGVIALSILAGLLMICDKVWKLTGYSFCKILNQNIWTIGLFVYFLVGAAVATLRGGSDWNIWVIFLLEAVSIIVGLYLSVDDKFRNYGILSLVLVMAIHSVLSANAMENFEVNLRALDAEAKNLTFTETTYMGSSGHWGGFASCVPLGLSLLTAKGLSPVIKMLVGLMLVISTYTIVHCGFATPVALMILGIVLVVVLNMAIVRKHSERKIGAWLSGIVILFLIWRMFWNITNSENALLEDISMRFNNILAQPLGGGYDEENSRFELLKMSWNSFKETPFFGGGGDIRSNDYTITGGHSSMFDYLAIMGLLGGGGAFIVMVLRMLMTVWSNMIRTRNFDAVCHFACFVTFVVGGIINPYWYGNCFIVVAAFCKVYLIKRKPVLGSNPWLIHGQPAPNVVSNY